MSAGDLLVEGLTWLPLGGDAPVLDGINLRIEPGERVLLAGTSGAGKSTLLRAMAGVLGEHVPGEQTGGVSLAAVPVTAGTGAVGFVPSSPLTR